MKWSCGWPHFTMFSNQKAVSTYQILPIKRRAPSCPCASPGPGLRVVFAFLMGPLVYSEDSANHVAASSCPSHLTEVRPAAPSSFPSTHTTTTGVRSKTMGDAASSAHLSQEPATNGASAGAASSSPAGGGPSSPSSSALVPIPCSHSSHGDAEVSFCRR